MQQLLGKKQDTFRPSIVGYLINLSGYTILCVSCGYLVLRYVQASSPRPEDAITSALGLIGIIVGICFAWREVKNLFYHVDLYEGGFVVIDRNISEIVTWDDIEHLRERRLVEFLPIMIRPGKVECRNIVTTYLIKRKDKTSIEITSKMLDRHEIFAEAMKKEIFFRKIPWSISESC
ncbi:DUF6585 family protein [Calycomorphotria hydatis]|uniref:Uncharacterized protein n=1 Tax=Calycomorphotria hydatis TaxID=2528027 RepID=A0A517T6U0_9PLAN|nr:DUF6585 family protein [Calycomorphotria hydatis]QDT64095.1 hypothetical protein V22_13260 [Calycomorphotria hydatis]